MNELIPEDVRQFLFKNIDSVAQWEGLLQLRADPAKAWSTEALARNIYTSEQETAQLLKQLATRNMIVAVKVQSSVAYRYRPASHETELIIDHAAELYRQYLIPMTNLIHSKSKARIQEFADAFKIRKE